MNQNPIIDIVYPSASDTPVSIIPDEDFRKVMDTQVIPMLSGICRTGYLPVEGSLRCLYYESYLPPKAKGAVVISHGFCESIEKYKEVIYYFVSAGFQVHLADHRGHGRSLRDTTHPNMVHIEHFSDYVTDLHKLITSVVKPAAGELPLYLYGHSMGGGISALYLETFPDTFQKAILNAPMLEIALGSFPTCFAKAFGFFMNVIGFGRHYAITQHAFFPNEKFEESGSANLIRYRYYQDKREQTPLFQTCGSSYRWVYQSLKACDRITRKKNCDRISIPVLVFASPKDTFVKASGILRFVKNVPSSYLVSIPGSKHEIYNSTASVLEGYYQEIWSFLSSSTNPA